MATFSTGLVVKVRFGQEVRRLPLAQDEQYQTLVAKIETLFGLKEGGYALTYSDEDGDAVSVDSQAELVEAIKVAVSTNILRVTINKPLTRLASSSQEGEKKQKKSSSPTKKKGTPNPPALPQPLPEKATNTEGKMERLDSVGLSEKPPVTDSVDKKDPPQWFTDHMDKFSVDLFKHLEHLPNQTISGVLTGLDSLVVQHLGGDLVRTVMPPAAPYHHQGILCDNCNNPIVGVRYKCGSCADYDLCEFCESQEGIHQEDHLFLKVRRPLSRLGMNKKGKMKPLLTKNVYSKASELDTSSSEDEEEEEQKSKDTSLNKKRSRRDKKKDRKEKMRILESKMSHIQWKLQKLALERETESQQDVDMSDKVTPWDARLLADGNLPDMSTVPYGREFTKEWIVCNSGSEPWRGVTLKHVAGVPPLKAALPVPDLQPGGETCVRVTFSAVTTLCPGQILTSSFRFVHDDVGLEGGRLFGDRLWVSVVLKEMVDSSSILSNPVNSSKLQAQLEAVQEYQEMTDPQQDREPNCDLHIAEMGPRLHRSVSTPSLVSVGEEQVPGSGDSSDDFVVIIPPCFDPHAPLSALEAQHSESGNQEGLAPPDWEVLPSPTGPQAQVDTPTTNEEPPVRISPSSSPRANRGVALNCGRRTLREATLREPLSVATGLVNSVANFVKEVHFSRAQNSQSADLTLQDLQSMEENDLSGVQTDDDDLEDLLPLSPASGEHPVARERDREEEESRLHAPSRTQPSQDETTTGSELTQSNELQSPTQSTTAGPRASDAPAIRLPAPKYTPPQTKWTVRTPQEPMEKLVYMGFANRARNEQLLAKHNNHLRAVINELLDAQNEL